MAPFYLSCAIEAENGPLVACGNARIVSFRNEIGQLGTEAAVRYNVALANETLL